MTTNVTDYTTAEQAGIVAFYRSKDKTIRVYDMVDDFKVEFTDGSKMRWFSTHAAISMRADIQLALESFVGRKILQAEIDYI